jgi:signal transduction histidine kinase
MSMLDQSDDSPVGGLDPRFLQAAVDALSAHIAILRVDGTILAVNAAWRAFGRANGCDPAAGWVGTDYLSGCDGDDPDGRRVADAIRQVATGRLDRFEYEYPCHSPTAKRWFVVRVTRSPDAGRPFVVVAHEDVTARVLAEQERVRLLRDLLHAQEDERGRLARELHDGLGQALTSLRYGLHALAAGPVARVPVDAERLAGYAAAAQEEVRALAQGLRPTALDDLGLAAAVERLADTTRQPGGLRVQVVAPPAEGRPPRAVEAAVYRIVQEALANVANHAAARTADVILEVGPDRLRAVVEDDGRGFDPAATNGGLGLAGMRERAALFGGTVTVTSCPGRGTTVDVTLPFNATTDER